MNTSSKNNLEAFKKRQREIEDSILDTDFVAKHNGDTVAAAKEVADLIMEANLYGSARQYISILTEQKNAALGIKPVKSLFHN